METNRPAPHVLVFGCGPMPCEPAGAVMAPGGRTWQILRTVAEAIADQPGARLDVYCLESKTRSPFTVRAGRMGATIHPMGIEDFTALEKGFAAAKGGKGPKPSAIVGCASIQPCATATDVARALGVPVWADVFGDPIAEVQSAVKQPGALSQEHEDQLLHVWRLLARTLAGADRFSTLSGPQRLALIGQLGCVGRLNAATAGAEMVESIPFGLWPDEVRPPAAMPPTPEFRLLWSGSFNTWTDPETLGRGLALALKEEPRLRLDILGGGIAGYHESGYERFKHALANERAPMDQVALLDWRPYAEMPAAHARCHAGLSLDRWTYEAVLGSRTRIVHMLHAGRPVVSTTLSELTRDMAAHGVVTAVEPGNPRSLADAILSLARIDRTELDRMGDKAAAVAREFCSAPKVGRPLADWLAAPSFAPDQKTSPTNALLPFWQRTVRR